MLPLLFPTVQKAAHPPYPNPNTSARCMNRPTYYLSLPPRRFLQLHVVLFLLNLRAKDSPQSPDSAALCSSVGIPELSQR